MKTVWLILALLITVNSFAQKIAYDLPKEMESQMSAENYKYLVSKALPIVSVKYQVEEVKNGALILKPGQDMQAFNLDNVILKCADVSDTSKWEPVIKEHFDNLFASTDAKKKINPKSFESVKQYLGIRIYPAGVVAQRGGAGNFITRADLQGTYTFLMLDLPGGFAPVLKADFDSWNMNADTLFRIALSNVGKQPVEKVVKKNPYQGVKIEMTLLGNEDYAASYALDLANNSPELIGEWGSAVAVPNKGIVTICKISKDKPVDFVKFIQATYAVVNQYYNQHPQRISNQFFWYYKGAFQPISVSIDDKKSINIVAPVGLSELMTAK